MYFLIDYENRNFAGLEGTEFLEMKDTISIFFSESCEKIIAHYMQDIERSECKFEIFKLKKARNNALDFYIATRIGEILALDKNAQIAIISSDKGFKSVIDFWKDRLQYQNQMVLCPSIAKAIIEINGEGARKKIVNEKIKVLELQVEYAKYEERNKVLDTIIGMFKGTEHEKFINQIVDMFKKAHGAKELYLDSVKTFGKANGIEIYRKIKNSELCA